MKSIFLLVYLCLVCILFYQIYKLLVRKELPAFVFSLFFVFFLVPDFMILDAFGIGISWMFVFLFVCVVPALYLMREQRASFFVLDWFYLGLIGIIFIYAIYSYLFKGCVAEYFGEKIFNYVYILLIPSVLVVLCKKEIVKTYSRWSRIVILALLAYAFKNFYLAGIVGFRDTYLANYEQLKNVIFASRLLGIGVLLCAYNLKKHFSLYEVLAACIFFFQMLLFESRGPMLAVVLALVFFFLRDKVFSLQKKEMIIKKDRSLVIQAMTIVLVVVVLLVGTKYLVESGSLMRIITKTQRMMSGQSEERSLIYPAAIAAIGQAFPFGIGFGNSFLCLAGYGGTYQYYYPHNLILEILLEEGFGISLFFFAFIVLTIYLFFTKKKNGSEKSIWLMIYLFTMINAMFSGDIAANNFVFVFGYLAAANRILAGRGVLDE